MEGDEGDCRGRQVHDQGTGGLVVVGCRGTCCGTAGAADVLRFVAKAVLIILIIPQIKIVIIF